MTKGKQTPLKGGINKGKFCFGSIKILKCAHYNLIGLNNGIYIKLRK